MKLEAEKMIQMLKVCHQLLSCNCMSSSPLIYIPFYKGKHPHPQSTAGNDEAAIITALADAAGYEDSIYIT
jgi:hypothetical protein